MNEVMQDLLAELGTNRAKRGLDWNGCEVYMPIYSGNPKIGLPLVVLKDENGYRISTDEESLAYLDYTNEVGRK